MQQHGMTQQETDRPGSTGCSACATHLGDDSPRRAAGGGCEDHLDPREQEAVAALVRGGLVELGTALGLRAEVVTTAGAGRVVTMV